MSDSKSGYGPPSLESIRVERVAGKVQEVTAPATQEAGSLPSEPIRVTLRGGGFVTRAMPLIVEIGDQATANIRLAPDGRSITCEFERLPEEGATIRVGYPPDDFTELPERFSAAMIEPGDAGEPDMEGGL